MTNNLASFFFLISDSLLWPVMFGLALGLALALWQCGQTAREGIERLRERKVRAKVEDALRRGALDDAQGALDAQSRAPRSGSALATLAALFSARDDAALLENTVADAQNRGAERSTTLRALMKLGPAFGLMGTLIPLGPALVGLATGDLETLAHNLMIAFSTTVVGLAVSSLAYLAATFRKRWTTRDAILTTFAATRLLDALDAQREDA
ncbi:MAG: MotA/TolQ/ExbB proton channel family protein [Thermoguttaceae bacterium]|nr:MotA/TolQ/ExbB proton channel family protein [Thermoguttaceae bacterium]